MNDKLNTLSIFLKESNLAYESNLVNKLSNLRVKIAKKSPLTDAVNKLISENPELFPSSPSRAILHEVTKEPVLPAEFDETTFDDSKLQDWHKLLSAINENKKFNYEITLSEISKSLGLESESIRAKGSVPATNEQSRREIIKLLESSSLGTALEDRADDQYSQGPKLVDVDLETINSSIKESVKHIVSSLPKGEAERINDKIEKEHISKEAFVKGIGSTIMKSLPIVGVLISLPLFVKNLTEAYSNSLIIIEKLPLSKYGLSSSEIISPMNIANALSHIEDEINKNSDSPKNLMEILEIISVTKAFQLDVIFAITNGIALILDIISLVLWGFPDIISKFAATIYSIADFIIQIVFLFGTEIISEKVSDTYWTSLTENIKEIAEAAISNLEKAKIKAA